MSDTRIRTRQINATGTPDATTFLRGDATWEGIVSSPSTGAGGTHVHGLARWSAPSGTTTFDLPDLAEYIDGVMIGGAEQDPLVYSLSTDRSQMILDSAVTSVSTVLCHYVLASL